MELRASLLKAAIALRFPRSSKKKAARIHEDAKDFLAYLTEETCELDTFFTSDTGVDATYMDLQKAITDFSTESKARLLLGKFVRVLILIDDCARVLVSAWDIDHELSEVKRRDAFSLVIHTAILNIEFDPKQANFVHCVSLAAFRSDELHGLIGTNNSPVFPNRDERYFEVVCNNPQVWGFTDDVTESDIKHEITMPKEPILAPVKEAEEDEQQSLVQLMLDNLFPERH
jgi:hypothetical protein